MKNTDSAEDYIASSGDREESLRVLREILLLAGLVETVKWGGIT